MRIVYQATAVFFAMVALGIVFALYVIETARQAAVAASFYAALIQVFNIFVVRSFMSDRRLAAPCVAGAFVGTWLAITFI